MYTSDCSGATLNGSASGGFRPAAIGVEGLVIHGLELFPRQSATFVLIKEPCVYKRDRCGEKGGRER